MDEFEILAAKVISGDASAAEATRLRVLLGASAELRAEFGELHAVWKLIQDAAPLGQTSAPQQAVIPAERLQALRAAVQTTIRDRPLKAQPKVVTQSQEERTTDTPAFNDRESRGSMFTRLGEVLYAWIRPVSSPGAVATFLILVVVVASVFVWRRSNRSRGAERGAPVGLLIVEQGAVQIMRDGKPLSDVLANSVIGEDVISLAAGAKAFLTTLSRTLPLTGPRIISVRALLGELEPQGSPAPRSDRTDATHSTQVLRLALFTKPEQIEPRRLLVTTRSAAAIPLYSPLGTTANTTPTILWKAELGKAYDITISDELNPNAPPLRISRVKPPLEFNQIEAWRRRTLAPDGLYRLRLSESDRPLSASEYTFHTIEQSPVAPPGSPAEKLLFAKTLLETHPDRIGDVLAALLLLPPDFASSEVALRLELAAFGQLGYAEDFNDVLLQLRRLK